MGVRCFKSGTFIDPYYILHVPTCTCIVCKTCVRHIRLGGFHSGSCLPGHGRQKLTMCREIHTRAIFRPIGEIWGGGGGGGGD